MSRAIIIYLAGWLVLIMATQGFCASTNFFTGVDTDLAINGTGYFVVKNPVIGATNYTRLGSFTLNANNFLVTSSGLRVQGFNTSNFNQIGDLQLVSYSDDGDFLSSFFIETNGVIALYYSDGTQGIAGQVLLQQFQNPSALTQVGNQLFASTAAAMPSAQPTPPDTNGAWSLLMATLELPVPELTISRFNGYPTNFIQGILLPTGVSTDFGIEGSGFFVLRRTNDNALFATRAGAFYLDANGYFVHYSGMRLQGYTGIDQDVMGDLQLDPGSSNLIVLYFYSDERGQISAILSDGSSVDVGQIVLQTCTNTDLLVRADFDLYAINTNSDFWQPAGIPETGGRGSVLQGLLEQNQLDASLLSVRSNQNFFLQGEIENSGIPSTLAISGAGFFTVRDPVNNIFYAKRSGNFTLDNNTGYLITPEGFRVQGMNDTNLTRYGDILIDNADTIYGFTSYSFDYDGTIHVTLTDGTAFVRGRVLLQQYKNLQALQPIGDGAYSNVMAALPLFTNGLSNYTQISTIIYGALELSVAVTPLELPPTNSVRLLVKGLASYADVEASDDLVHWSVIGEVQSSDLNEAEFFDVPNLPRRFYRVDAHY